MNKATVFVILIFLLIAAQTVYAKIITVDGNGAEWVPAEIIVDDDDNDHGGAGIDLDIVYFTNSTTTAYFRVDTVGASDFSGNNTMLICINSDNDTDTGTSNCESSGGQDYIIAISPSNTCDATGPLLLFTASTGLFTNSPSLNRATTGSITEIEIALSEIGITNDRTISITAWMDSTCESVGDTTGAAAAIVGVGSPTSVSLESIRAQSKTANTVLIVLVVMLAGTLLGTITLTRK